MSNYLITLKLNELQTQVNTLKEVDGLTNPLVPEVNFDANSNDIINVGIMSCAEINAAGTITCEALDASTLQIPIINTGTLTAGTVVSTGGVSGLTGTFTNSLSTTDLTVYQDITSANVFTGDVTSNHVYADNLSSNSELPVYIQSTAQFNKGATVGVAETIGCSTSGQRYTISDVQINNANLLALTNQQTGGTNLSISSNIVNNKSMLTVRAVDGSNVGNIYDSYYNQPPSVVATSLAGILATSSDAGGGNITNLSNLTSTGDVTSNTLNVLSKSNIRSVGLPTNSGPGVSSNFCILKANGNPAIGPICPSFGFIAGSNPDPSLPAFYSCLNDNVVNPALAIVRVTNTTSSAINLTFSRCSATSPFYLALIFGYTLPSSSYFNTIELSYNNLTFNSTFSTTGVVKLNIVPVITNSASEFDANTTNAHAFSFQLPQTSPFSWTISNSNNVLLTNYILPVTSPKVYLAAYIDIGDSALPSVSPLPFTSIILDNAVITLSNSRLTNNPPVSFSPAVTF